jgi:hypothetical protein
MATKGGAGKKAPERKFKVTLEVAGAMIDKDTPISDQALIDYFEMTFASAKGLKVSRVEAEEIVS